MVFLQRHPVRLAAMAAALAFATGACDGEPEPVLGGSAATVHGEMTAHFVTPTSDDVVLRAMAYDMRARSFSYMGPEDVHHSSELEGYPFVLITRNGPVALPAVGSALYEHEFTHMAAAKNVLDRDGTLLANLMRPEGCAFTSRARFHEVCADWKRFVSPGYQSAAKMAELLEVVEPIAPAFERTDDFVGRVDITGIDLVDAACLWDLPAMDALTALYDGEEGEGAFAALFPPHDHKGSCIADHMAVAEFEIDGPPTAECVQTTVSLNLRPAPTLASIPFTSLPRGGKLRITGDEADGSNIHWIGVTRPTIPCEAEGQDGQCWVAASFTEPCPSPPAPDAGPTGGDAGPTDGDAGPTDGEPPHRLL